MSTRLIKDNSGKWVDVTGSGASSSGPVGSYLTMEDNSVTPQGYLLADGRDTTGTDDELLTKYPLLYAYLGNTNVLPTEFNHSNLSDLETILSGSDLTDITAAYDGIIHVLVRTNTADRYIQVNGQNAGLISSSVVTHVDVEVNKGDIVSITGGTSVQFCAVTANYYKTHKYIKAVSGIETSSTEASEVANTLETFKAYCRAQDILSEYEDLNIPTTGTYSFTADYDGFIKVVNYSGGNGGSYVTVNNIQVSRIAWGGTSGAMVVSDCVPIKYGDNIKIYNASSDSRNKAFAAYYKQRDYSTRI